MYELCLEGKEAAVLPRYYNSINFRDHPCLQTTASYSVLTDQCPKNGTTFHETVYLENVTEKDGSAVSTVSTKNQIFCNKKKSAKSRLTKAKNQLTELLESSTVKGTLPS